MVQTDDEDARIHEQIQKYADSYDNYQMNGGVDVNQKSGGFEWWYFLIIILIVLAIIGGYFLVKKKMMNKCQGGICRIRN